MNPIHRALTARIKSLLASSEEAASIPHAATVGQLREQILIDFFRALIPQNLSITSGIICDSKGRVSHQTDFIIKNDLALPSIVMTDAVAIVPVEAVHLIAEIKSKLKTNHLKKLMDDRVALNVLELATWPSPPPNVNVKIPSVVIAFDCEVAVDTLREWMNEANDVVSVCVVGMYSLSKTDNGIEFYESDDDKPIYYETLRFAEQLFNFLGNSLMTQRGTPVWSAYLRGVDDINGN